MTGNYANQFGGAAIKPSQVSYEALTIAVTTPLFWPTESLEGVPYVAAQIDVTASAGGLQLQMPNALQGSTGQACIVTNVGSNSFTLTDQSGNSITTLATTQSWLITLTNNTTANGSWRAYQMASTASSATAGSLAGNGLQAFGSLLQTYSAVVPLSVNTPLTTANRANLIVWTGGVGTLQLDPVASVTPGWYVSILNIGTGIVTVTTTGGQTINTQPTLQIPANTTATINAGAAAFFTSVLPALLAFNFTGVNLQTFTSSGTYTPTAGTKFALLIITGPGGSGGVFASGTSIQGGGAGETAIGIVTANQIGANQTITIGAGGLGITSSPSVPGNPGQSATSFGILLTAAPGLGGANAGINFPGNGGTGGTGLGLHIKGGSGLSPPSNSVSFTPPGGASFWGGPGHVGGVTGAYGCGGYAWDGSGGTSGAGVNGVALIVEFQ